MKPVHGIEVADVCIADSVENRYLRNDVNLSMYLDVGFRGFELCPSEDSETKVNGRGVDGVESSRNLNSLVIRNRCAQPTM